MARKKDSPQKAARREMMDICLKENNDPKIVKSWKENRANRSPSRQRHVLSRLEIFLKNGWSDYKQI